MLPRFFCKEPAHLGLAASSQLRTLTGQASAAGKSQKSFPCLHFPKGGAKQWFHFETSDRSLPMAASRNCLKRRPEEEWPQTCFLECARGEARQDSETGCEHMRKQGKSRFSGSGETSSIAAGSGARCPAEALAVQVQNSSQDDRQREAMASSSCGDGKGCVAEMAHPLRLQCCDCEELVHQLANVITPILIHAQMLEWKLPPYSHLKRPVRELERNARRAGELLKAMTRRAADGNPGTAVEICAGNGTAHEESARQSHKRV